MFADGKAAPGSSGASVGEYLQRSSKQAGSVEDGQASGQGRPGGGSRKDRGDEGREGQRVVLR
jgi:hypothetical protein